jgi:tetratricopeptide (TPR) repeat protein
MLFQWFNAQDAANAGIALADSLTPSTAPRSAKAARKEEAGALRELLQRADREVRTLRLNFYKKAKFANSFKWRLIENGVEPKAADEVTQALILHLSQEPAGTASEPEAAAPIRPSGAGKAHPLLAQANKCLDEGKHAQAVEHFREFLTLQPRNPEALCNLGVALAALGRYQEAEQSYREAIEIDPLSAEALFNLATLLQANPAEAEPYLRRVLKINPKNVDARSKLGLTLAFKGHTREAAAAFKKALKAEPRNAEALLGLALIARSEGRFEEAESIIRRTLKVDPKLPGGWAAMMRVRRMTTADREWLKEAEKIAASGISLWQEAELRYAIGKCLDDVDDYEAAFQNYRRANELLKTVTQRYDHRAHSKFAEDMIRGHSREALSRVGNGGSASMKPVFVVGMPRSGTSLIEQIIASHPSAKGAGELQFWLKAQRAHDGELRHGLLGEPAREKLAGDYLRVLELRDPGAPRVVDKNTFNCDHLGLLHSVFPKARIIYVRRDPIDTCLSCYFQNFSTELNFTLDLSDLAHYYTVNQRLMRHWCSALPAGTLLEVPYEELVADQVAWTHKIIDFLELDWDDRCLSFHETDRAVNTASAWQVRQKIYNRSVARWRHYEKFIGPLKALKSQSF